MEAGHGSRSGYILHGRGGSCVENGISYILHAWPRPYGRFSREAASCDLREARTRLIGDLQREITVYILVFHATYSACFSCVGQDLVECALFLFFF